MVGADIWSVQAAGGPARVERLVMPPIETNSYVIFSETGRALVVDPGSEPERILKRLDEVESVLEGILLTHGHWDHTAGIKVLQGQAGGWLALHHDDRPFMGAGLQPDRLFAEGPFPAGPWTFEVLPTPGHTPGSVSFRLGQALFTGDAIFAGSVGRTDLPGSSFSALARALVDRVASLPEGTLILPGHGPPSTLGQERETNPFLRWIIEEVR